MMRKGNIFGKILALATVCSMFLATVTQGATFSDVPSNHWAQEQISTMADLGIMVGDSSGKYYPNQVVDKFYASKAMAKLAGYKTVGYTASEKTYQDNAYEANKSILNMFKKTFSKWDSTADREIAFLLEKQILTVEDLNQFVVTNNNVQSVKPLTKEETAVFLVRLMNKQATALSTQASEWQLYQDDSTISAFAKPYVYYFKKIGIFSGGDDKFYPKNSVTKAIFATILSGVYNVMNGGLPVSETPAQNVIESKSGTIVEVYGSRYALQIEDTLGKKSINNVALGTSITIDGFEKTFSDLKPSMSCSAVLVNDELTNVKATTAAETSSYVPDTVSAPSLPTSNIEGTVSNVGSDTVARTISIDVKMLNSIGNIYEETRVFKLSDDCKVSRGSTAINLSQIAKGDIVSLQVSGNTVYSIDAQQAQMGFSGILVERKKNDITNTRFFVVEDRNGKQYDLIVNDQTVIERANSGSLLSWTDLKLGDKVDVKTNYNVITYIKGEGVRTNVEGYVREMHIFGDDSAKIVFEDLTTKETVEYSLVSSLVDVYSLRIGDKVRLRLDSWEIDSYTKLENSSTQNVSGKITSIRSTYFVLSLPNNAGNYQIYFDSNTYVYDTGQRKSVSPAVLGQNMDLFVTYQPGTNNYATSITILNR